MHCRRRRAPPAQAPFSSSRDLSVRVNSFERSGKPIHKIAPRPGQGRQRHAHQRHLHSLCILISFGVSCSVFPCESSSPSCLPCRCRIDECSRRWMDEQLLGPPRHVREGRRVRVRVEIPSVWIGVGLAVDCSINRGQGRRRPVKRIRPGPLRIRVRRRRRLLFPSSPRALGPATERSD